MPSSSEYSGHRDALAEARSVVGEAFDPAILEPAPPAVITGPFFADDPVAPVRRPDTRLVGPGPIGDLSWDDWLVEHPDTAGWVAERWLGGNRRLPDVPQSLPGTRTALHRLAAYVIAPARYAVNGKFGLRWTLGGFGTPFFTGDRQIRVVGDMLIDQRAGDCRAHRLSSLRAAADFLETAIDPSTAAEDDSPPLGDVEEPLGVDPTGSRFLGDWFGMAVAALEGLRADPRSVDPSRPQLWPGHFDPAIEEGDDDHRASHGASPGDDAVSEPYLYTSFWWPDRVDLDRSDQRWNAGPFTGAILPLSAFPAQVDPVAVALDFYRSNRDAAAGRL